MRFKVEQLVAVLILAFFTRFVNNTVYDTQERDIDDLRCRTHEAIALVTEEMLKNARER